MLSGRGALNRGTARDGRDFTENVNHISITLSNGDQFTITEELVDRHPNKQGEIVVRVNGPFYVSVRPITGNSVGVFKDYRI